MATKSTDRIWHFDVSEPTLHPSGFTIYKVSCKVFQVHSPESMTEVVVWKRYNDFKELFRATSNIHKSLHRKEEFPKFAKPKLFGRFEDNVIEERRQSAVSLLNFIGVQSHLYKSKVFQEFIKGGKMRQGISGNILKPSKLDILARESQPISELQGSQEILKPTKHPPDGDQEDKAADNAEDQEDSTDTSEPKGEQLEGVWNFPQIPDNISLNSYDDSDEVDVESTLSTSLPDTELSFFDPIKPEDKLATTPDLHTSSSWLFAAMNTCADMEADDQNDGDVKTPVESEEGIQINFDDKSDISAKDLVSDTLRTRNDSLGSSKSSSTTDISEFDPLRTRKDSKVECGKGDLDLSITTSGGSSSLNTSRSSSATSSPRHQTTRSPLRMRSHTGESVSTMDLGGKEDYIYVAANQICMAQEHEANGRHDMAFSCYKVGVGILLQGVQGDKNKARRDAVRRKTAQYLIKAEDLYNRHLAQENLDEKRWATDTDFSPLAEIDPGLSMLKGPIGELKNYKVLGTMDKVLLVMDKTSDETYTIKTVHKSSTCSRKLYTILPTSCPFMVNLHKFYETDSAIYLLLQHATGGKLWNYIGAYLQAGRQYKDNLPGIPNSKDNVYSGQKIHTTEESEKTDKTCDNAPKQQNICSENRNQLPSNKDGNSSSNCRPSENHASNHQLNDAPDIYQGVSENESSDILKDIAKTEKTTGGKKLVHRQSTYSMSSVEDMGEFSANEQSANLSVDQNEFTDVLQEKSNSALQFFSINSIDSSDDVPQDRQDSTKSLSDVIDCIIEESELSPPSQGEEMITLNQPKETWTENEVFCADTTQSDNAIKCAIKDNDAEEIVKNAQELIRNVERTLSQTDAEVEAAIYPQKLSDICSEEHTNKSTIPTSKTDSAVSSLTVSDNLSKGNTGSCDTLVDEHSDSSNEVSIYDLNRSNEGQSSSSDTNDNEKGQGNIANLLVKDVSNDKLEKVDISLKPRSATESSSGTVTSGKDSRSSTITDFKINPPAKLSLVRLNSKELSRSASMERELSSPLKLKTRSLSSVFGQLDLAASSPEQVKLPESCIRQWAAEIVVAISRLHAENIICRDLKPDNILLGERGHILLTYFCQLSTTDKELDFEAVDQLYVAPEVRGISGHTQVCDWWSLGALLFELLIGRTLYSCHLGGITSHTQLYIPENVSSEARGLLQQLLCFNPRERLGGGINGAEDIKAHPFFNSIDWNSLES